VVRLRRERPVDPDPEGVDGVLVGGVQLEGFLDQRCTVMADGDRADFPAVGDVADVLVADGSHADGAALAMTFWLILYLMSSPEASDGYWLKSAIMPCIARPDGVSSRLRSVADSSVTPSFSSRTIRMASS
jgi:hypothetical protein